MGKKGKRCGEKLLWSSTVRMCGVGFLVVFPTDRALGLCANILKIGGGASMGGEVFSIGVGFKVGEGSRVHFWLNDWLGGCPLYVITKAV